MRRALPNSSTRRMGQSVCERALRSSRDGHRGRVFPYVDARFRHLLCHSDGLSSCCISISPAPFATCCESDLPSRHAEHGASDARAPLSPLCAFAARCIRLPRLPSFCSSAWVVPLRWGVRLDPLWHASSISDLTLPMCAKWCREKMSILHQCRRATCRIEPHTESSIAPHQQLQVGSSSPRTQGFCKSLLVHRS